VLFKKAAGIQDTSRLHRPYRRTFVSPNVFLLRSVLYRPALPNKSFSASRPPSLVISASVSFTEWNSTSKSFPDSVAIRRLGWIPALNSISCSTPFPKPGMRCSVVRNALAEILSALSVYKASSNSLSMY